MGTIETRSNNRFATLFMQLHIKSDRYIWELQKDFNLEFPYLKLEFFSRPHSANQPSPAKKIISAQHRISELAKKPLSDILPISESMSVANLESAFLNQYGLSVQVFRKSGNIWLETTMTDSWSLKQQNDHGKEITVGVPRATSTNEPIDYDAI